MTATPELTFRCPLSSGLHARPASHLAEVAGRFACAIELRNERNGILADVKSVMALVAADLQHDDPCRVRFDGADAPAAREALSEFVARTLPGCDVPLPAPPAQGPTVLPRVLLEAGASVVPGLTGCGGVRRGRGRGAGGLALPRDEDDVEVGSAAEEEGRAVAALAAVRAELEVALAARPSATEAGMLGVQLALARDTTIAGEITQRIAAGRSARRAVAEAGRHLASGLMQSASAVVRERAIDVEDLFEQLLERLSGAGGVRRSIELEGPTVLLAESLAPRQLLALDRSLLRGLLLEHAGATSHAVILARSFGIPTLTGVRDARAVLSPGDEVAVDADLGFAVREDAPRIRRHYDRQVAVRETQRALLEAFTTPPATTRDGRRLEVGANVGSVEELELALATGAEGVGLFRTEMLYLDRAEAPSEEEQVALLERAVRVAAGRRLIVRSFDVGGDKPLPWLDLPAEANPSLGRRGVRLYPELQALFDAQVRAVLRASALGPLRLMVPMIATPGEARWVRERVTAVAHELSEAGVAFDEGLEVGAMIEVPAAAFALDELARHFDFFSIGTNDLGQYFLAADRENERVAALRDRWHPAFLRLLSKIALDARRLGRWVGMCGEMARDPRALPLLVGLELDEISVAAPAVLAAKRGLARLEAPDCRELLDRACAAADADDVDALLAAHRGRTGKVRLSGPELVVLDSDSASKAEVIQELVDLLHANLRTEDPLAVEQAIWSREEAYSTGLGDGFAVPHCKTDAVAETSLAVVRLAQPVDWDALDGAPVRCAILLAVRASDGDRAHLEIFSALARRLVHHDFQSRLLEAPDTATLLADLRRELEPHATGERRGHDASTP